MKKFSAIFAALLILTASIAYAQEQTGEVMGTVKDTEGVPLPGVTVEGRSPTMIGGRTDVTDEMGRFRLIGLTPGTYEITFSLSGFQTLKREGILVRLGRTFSLDVTLP